MVFCFRDKHEDTGLHNRILGSDMFKKSVRKSVEMVINLL